MANRRTKDSKVPAKGWFRKRVEQTDSVVVKYWRDGEPICTITAVQQQSREVVVMVVDHRRGQTYSEIFPGNPAVMESRVLSMIDWLVFSIGVPKGEGIAG